MHSLRCGRRQRWFIDRMQAKFANTEVANSREKRTDEAALRGANVMIEWGLSPELLRIR